MATLDDIFNTLQELKKQYDSVADIVNKYDELYKSEEDKYNRGKFRESHADLDEYSDVLKKLKGDDFDIFDSAYDEYNSDFKDKLDEDSYCSALKENIRKALDSVKAALTPEEKEEIAEQVAEEIEKPVEETVTTETDVDGDGEPDVVEVEEKTEEDSNTDEEDEIDDDDSDLEEYLKSHEDELKNWRK